MTINQYYCVYNLCCYMYDNASTKKGKNGAIVVKLATIFCRNKIINLSYCDKLQVSIKNFKATLKMPQRYI